MTPEEQEVVFNETDGASRSWTSGVLSLATRWQVRRRRERVAIVVLAAFVAVGLSLVGRLNSEIVEVDNDNQILEVIAPSSQLLVDESVIPEG